ncbi:hypothetical protein QYE76_067768 [Lolium multiflorum]|uniref:FRIGIDA-like protein n=1 Tax=Lolium multiflorum TaxID=4521 RepID=A0AAD8SEY4_LOLMU|nr:hypothetical protein QYE76_067768 [Lolium multiflorum]
MSRVHPMWLYSGPKDETRVNVVELSEKELDEVRRLTLFSQEDSIPLISFQPPFDADHPPTEVESYSSKLDGAIKIVAEARQNADSLKDELERLKRKLKDKETSRLDAEAQMNEKDDLLRQFVLALLKAADIPVEALDKLPNNSPANALSLTLESHKLVQALLEKNKGVMEMIHSMIFPKVDQNKTLEKLTDAFVVDTKKVIEVESYSSKLDGAIKIVAEARQNADSLKDELERLKRKLKDKETSRLDAEAQMNEKDDLLRQFVLALLKAADIPVEALDKLPNNSPANALSLTLESHKLVQALLEKNKGVMEMIHSMIFPKVDQNKTLEKLTDAFVVDTKKVIEVFKRTSRTYGALLAFQLMMGHGFKADIEQMSKELPKEQDGRPVDLGDFKIPALKCARQLLELVSARKSSTAPSLSNQTQAP